MNNKIIDESKIVHTNWAQSTTNPGTAMHGLISCLENGLNAWLELRCNDAQDFPIKIKNPALDNPFNWTMSYGTVRNEKELLEHHYFNETEKDLTYNWVACFGNKEAVQLYQEKGIISEGLINGFGICHPVKIRDSNKYRKKIAKDNYEYGYWVTFWKPIDGIPYYIPDPSVKRVITICYNYEPVNKADALRKAAEFIGRIYNKENL